MLIKNAKFKLIHFLWHLSLLSNLLLLHDYTLPSLFLHTHYDCKNSLICLHYKITCILSVSDVKEEYKNRIHDEWWKNSVLKCNIKKYIYESLTHVRFKVSWDNTILLLKYYQSTIIKVSLKKIIKELSVKKKLNYTFNI